MRTHKSLVAHLIYSGVLFSPRIAAAFADVDRRNFVPKTYEDVEVYADTPLSIGYEQTISQPTTVAIMLELLQPQVGDNILDVGSGSGWTTALLAHVVGESGMVYGVDIVPELVVQGSKNIKKYTSLNGEISSAQKVFGLLEHAPYDKILVSAAGSEIPGDLIDQLEIGGAIVMPVHHALVRAIKEESDMVTTKQYLGFSFVPLLDPSLS